METLSSNARSNPKSSKAHKKNKGSQVDKIPDYILCGHLNLHKSAANAAVLSRHITNQWKHFRINKDGVISSRQLEINRNPDGYGGLKDGKPHTVTEWNKIQKEKLLEKRKELAAAEVSNAGADGAGKSGTKGNAGRGRGSSRGRGGRGASRGRGRGRGRGRSRSRSTSTRSANQPVGNADRAPETNADTKRVKQTLKIKQIPQIANRNLRDKGDQLPRSRGPDKPPSSSQQMVKPPAAFEVSDEFAPDALHPELTLSGQNPVSQLLRCPTTIPQFDGNLSLSSNEDTTSEDEARSSGAEDGLAICHSEEELVRELQRIRQEGIQGPNVKYIGESSDSPETTVTTSNTFSQEAEGVSAGWNPFTYSFPRTESCSGHGRRTIWGVTKCIFICNTRTLCIPTQGGQHCRCHCCNGQRGRNN